MSATVDRYGYSSYFAEELNKLHLRLRFETRHAIIIAATDAYERMAKQKTKRAAEKGEK